MLDRLHQALTWIGSFQASHPTIPYAMMFIIVGGLLLYPLRDRLDDVFDTVAWFRATWGQAYFKSVIWRETRGLLRDSWIAFIYVLAVLYMALWAFGGFYLAFNQ